LKKSLVIDADVQKQLLALPGEQFANVARKLLELGSAFGKPHEHTGLGIRKLRPDLFECRAGLSLRVLFRSAPGALIVRLIGTHDEVQKYLRGL
jgi:hypothetical protein